MKSRLFCGHFYFETPVVIGDNQYVVEFATEQVKGQDPNLLDLYNVHVKRNRFSASYDTLRNGPYTSNISQSGDGVNRNNTTIRPQGARGQFIRKHNTGEAIIQLFKSADASTVIHELGHFFLDDMRKFSDNETTAAQLDAINHTVTTMVLI